MRRLLAAIIIIVSLSACANDTIPLPQAITSGEPQSSPEVTRPEYSSVSEAPQIEQLPELRYPFVMPQIEHIHKNEMIRLLTEFGMEFLFPEFESIGYLDYKSLNVGVNLYWVAYDRNEELLLQGRGISQKDLIVIEELVIAAFPANERYPAHRTARRDDMTMIGKEFFGEQFEFPAWLMAPALTPLGKDSEFYIFSSWRGSGLPPTNYIAVDIEEKADVLVAVFLPFIINIDPSNNIIYDIEFFNFGQSNYHVDIDVPIKFNPHAEVSYYLGYVSHLPVPQEQLGTITVTLRHEESGRLIAVSSRYN